MQNLPVRENKKTQAYAWVVSSLVLTTTEDRDAFA